MTVRVLQFTLEAEIGDKFLAAVAAEAMADYFEAVRQGEVGNRQDEVFVARNGSKIVIRHFLRPGMSQDAGEWPVVDRSAPPPPALMPGPQAVYFAELGALVKGES